MTQGGPSGEPEAPSPDLDSDARLSDAPIPTSDHVPAPHAETPPSEIQPPSAADPPPPVDPTPELSVPQATTHSDTVAPPAAAQPPPSSSDIAPPPAAILPTSEPTPPVPPLPMVAVTNPAPEDWKQLADVPPANKQAAKAFPSIHTLRVEKYKNICIVTGSGDSYSVRTGWEFGSMVTHKDLSRSRFMAGTLVADSSRGWFVLCWGPVDRSEEEQRMSLFRLNRLQAIKEKYGAPCPPFNSGELMLEECIRLQQLYKFSPTQEGRRPVNMLPNFFSPLHTRTA